MISLHEQQAEEKRPTTIGMAWNRVREMVRPVRQANSKVGKNKQGRNNVHEIVAYLKTCGMDPDSVELRQSSLGGVHVTFYFNDDDTIESSSESSDSSRSQDDPVLRSNNKQGEERSASMKRQKAQAQIGIDIQDRLLREWTK